MDILDLMHDNTLVTERSEYISSDNGYESRKIIRVFRN